MIYTDSLSYLYQTASLDLLANSKASHWQHIWATSKFINMNKDPPINVTYKASVWCQQESMQSISVSPDNDVRDML